MPNAKRKVHTMPSLRQQNKGTDKCFWKRRDCHNDNSGNVQIELTCFGRKTQKCVSLLVGNTFAVCGEEFLRKPCYIWQKLRACLD